MADFDLPGLHRQRLQTGPYGTMDRHYVKASIAAIAAGDTYFVAPLPHGMVIHDVKVIVQDIAAGGDVVDVGTKQKGTGTYADDTDEFHDAIPISARASFSSLDRGFHEPKVIEASKVYLTVTAPAGNAIAAPFALGIYIDYQFQGTP